MFYRHELFSKTIGLVTVRAFAQHDDDAETDWMDEEAQIAVRDGSMVAFGTVVEVYKNGYTIGRDALWGSWVDGADDPYLLTVARTQVGPEALADARRTMGL